MHRREYRGTIDGRTISPSAVGRLDAATFLIATCEGYVALAKSAQDGQLLQSGKRRLVQFLESLVT